MKTKDKTTTVVVPPGATFTILSPEDKDGCVWVGWFDERGTWRKAYAPAAQFEHTDPAA